MRLKTSSLCACIVGDDFFWVSSSCRALAVTCKRDLLPTVCSSEDINVNHALPWPQLQPAACRRPPLPPRFRQPPPSAVCPLLSRPLITLRLVCKRWKRVFDSSARLTPRRWFVQPARLLGRGQGASATAADGSALVRLAACRAGVVRDAFVEEAHKQWRLEAVQQLTSLACLTLRADGDEEYPCERPGQALAQQQLGLAALPRLCRLSLNAAGLLEPSCQQLAAAAHLTSLNLGTFLYDVRICLPLLAACRACCDA